MIGSELLFDEKVVGYVVVERFDDPIAITPGIRIRLPVATSVAIFGIARHVEPIAAPSLAVPPAGQQTINQLFIAFRVSILREALNLFETGFQSHEVQISAADQDARFCLR